MTPDPFPNTPRNEESEVIDAPELTAREWEIILSCADCGINDQDNTREAVDAVTKLEAWIAARADEAEASA